MKKITVRVDDESYNYLVADQLCQKKKVSINKLVNIAIKEKYKQNPATNSICEMIELLKKMDNNIKKIMGTQKIHFNISSQHFVNEGFLTNADLKKDKIYQQILLKYSNFNN